MFHSFFHRLALAGLASAAAVASASAQSVTIHWDDHNVPYIVSGSDAAAFYGYGWALAEYQYPILEFTYAQSTGRLAELFVEPGPLSDYVGRDKDVLTQGTPALAQTIYDNMPAETKELVDAFVAGINDYYADPTHQAELNAAHPELIVASADPTTGVEVVAAGLALWTSNFARNANSLIEGAVTAEDLFSTTHSNEWVIRGDISSSGHPMLMVDPHIRLKEDFTIWPFLHAIFADKIRTVGFNQMGVPFTALGVKLPRRSVPGDRSLAWTVTAGPLDLFDVFQVTMNAAGDEYWYDGAWVPFDVEHFEIAQIGTTTTVPLDVKSTVHGQVLREEGDQAFALRMALDAGSDFNAQFHAMATAENMDEFFDALDDRAWPGGNMVVASNATAHADQIRYVLYGPTPVRDPATDWTQIIDGSTPDTLWTSLHPVSELPQVDGSQQDHFINNNVGIEKTWAGFSGHSFPDYMIFDSTLTSYRQERAQFLIDKAILEEDSITFLKMIDMANDKYYSLAAEAIPVLDAAYTAYGAQVSDPDAVLPALLPLLVGWGKYARVDENAVDTQLAPIMRYWQEAFGGKGGAYPGILGRPGFTLDETQSIVALEALLTAFEFSEFHGFPEWAAVHRIHRALPAGSPEGSEVSFPVGGVGTALRSVGPLALPDPEDPENPENINVGRGQAIPMVVQLGSNLANTHIEYSKALDNANLHTLDSIGKFSTIETEAWANEVYRELPLSPQEAAAIAVRSETLMYTP